MPDIILKVVSVDAAPPAHALARSFDANGGTIGRDESNAFSLPDKHRRVSRLHATVSFPAGVPTITNSSTSLPISVGEQQLDFGESMLIGHGALIEVGPYVLQAHLLSLDASPLRSPHAQSGLRTDNTSLPQPVVRQSSGMTVVLPPPVVAPAAVVPIAYSVAPEVQPISAPPVGAHFAAIGDLADLLGGIGGTPVGSVAPNLPPPMPAASTPAPFFAPPPPPVSFFPPPAGGVIPPAPAASDPFADLLAGIGGPVASRASTVEAVEYRAPVASPVHMSNGLSADPMAAFGTSPSPIVGSANSVLAGLGVPPPNGAATGAIPDHFNPFNLPSSTARNDADPLASLMGGGGQNQTSSANQGSHVAPSIDSLFQAAPSGASDAGLFGFQAQRPANDGTLDSLIRSNTASDPLALFNESAAAPAGTSRAMRNDSLEIGAAFRPPSAMRPNSGPPVAAPASEQLPFNTFAAAPSVMPSAPSTRPPAVSGSVAPDVLTEAFLRGAGLNAGALPHGLTQEMMTTIGSLLRSATAGAIDMLAARAATKREVQASVTIISVQANNPLKFLPNADSALLQLLGKKMPGFMRADVAMKDAFEDLRAHEVGVIAGTRAALTEVLGKFDPAVLGDKLTKGSVLESVMPSARKAKLWDMYLERYLQIRREAEDDFQSIFGRAFVQAYELETARIKGDSSGSGGER